MKKSLVVLMFCMLLLPFRALAQNVFSANGFSCNAMAGAGGITAVSCKGTFPDVDGAFSSIGYNALTISYEKTDGTTYSYYSESGCLMVIDSKQILITKKDGTKKSFSKDKPKDALIYCTVN
ncbi:MAG: hypothetical protein HN337_09390 [Deltaproteobacteria bacterium]|jgi:hypothetical protein|nr:hypothetical protein [Deltaproteobacteria bacterium]